MGNSNGRPVVITDEVRLDHFKLLRVVGKGAFGKVRIVERKDTGLTFALKYIRKDEIVRSENVRNIVRERRMLEHLNHPFLCNLRYSFQDYEYIYLVVDLMSGGDLRFHISRKTFTEDTVRFWMAELGCALRYIHNHGIVHRDVKPDNVLLDCFGHVHLADFNVASDFKPTKKLTSRSGTLAYLAPEVYEGNGYLSECDWWSLGVVFYECIYNKRPFEGNSHDDLANRIKAASPKYPTTNPQVSTACTSAMKALIQRNVTDRIGANGFENYMKHPFFHPIDFEALERLEVEPVFIPSTEKTNFDATYDLEELLLEESPLEARMKHQKPRPALKADATPREKRQEELHKMIEQYFEPFDYTAATFKEGNVFDRAVDVPGDDPRRPAPPQARLSHTSARSPVDKPIQRPVSYIRDPSYSRDQMPSPTATGSPPLTTQASIPTIRSSYTAQEPTSNLAAQTNAIAAVSNAIATPVPPPPQDDYHPQPFSRPNPGPRSKSMSVAHLSLGYRNSSNLGATETSGPFVPGTSNIQGQMPSSDHPLTQTTAASTNNTTPTKRPPRQVLSADSAVPNNNKKSSNTSSNSSRVGGESSSGKKGGGTLGGGGSKKGFLGMLSQKSGVAGIGREKSPKRLENGVLGKDGARVVVD